MTTELARHTRAVAFTRGMLAFVGLLWLGMPLAVVTLNYAAGWKVAVLAFPLLLNGLFSLSPKNVENRVHVRRRRIRRIVVSAVLFLVPLAAVVWDEPEIMRLWPYAVVLPFCAHLLTAPRGKISRGATVLTGIVFVSASDIIWLFGSIEGWIWFHAFAFPIFLFGFAFLNLAATHGNRAVEVGVSRDLAPPPRADGDVSSLGTCEIAYDGREKGVFRDVSLSQAQAIYASAWRGEYDHVFESVERRGSSNHLTFLVRIAGFEALRFGADENSTITVRWTSFDFPGRGRLIPNLIQIRAAQVPGQLGHAIIADVWHDDAEALRAKLKPFEEAVVAT